MSRYADDLKRIVGVDKINRTLKELADKAAIVARRGEAFYTPTGSLSSGEGNSGDSTNPSTKATEQSAAVTEAAKSAAAAALSGNKLSNLAGSIAGDLISGMANNFFRELDGVIDIGDLIDAANGNIAKEGLPGFSTLNSQIVGIDGLRDCASSKDLRVRFDGLYVPPLTWDSANNPPPITGWTTGYYYKVVGIGGSTEIENNAFGFTIQKACEAAIPKLEERYPAQAPFSFSYFTGSDFLGYTCYFNRAVGGSFSLSGNRVSCSLTPPPEPVCPSSQPSEDSWPPADVFQLSLDTSGYFKPNSYDANVPDNFANGVSTIDACFGTGRFATIEPASQGGYMVYETGTSGGTPTGIITVFNADGTIRAFTDSRSAYKLE